MRKQTCQGRKHVILGHLHLSSLPIRICISFRRAWFADILYSGVCLNANRSNHPPTGILAPKGREQKRISGGLSMQQQRSRPHKIRRQANNKAFRTPTWATLVVHSQALACHSRGGAQHKPAAPCCRAFAMWAVFSASSNFFHDEKKSLSCAHIHLTRFLT